MIISKTPFRISFVGGGSDFPDFYRRNIGAVVSTTIDKYMYLVVNKKFDGTIRLSYSQTEQVSSISEIQHPLIRNCLSLFDIKGGIEIASLADIPSSGTGLGSSSSYIVGLINAISAYKGTYISKSDLAKLACRVEIEMCNDSLGKQDQYAAAFGGLNLIRFHSDDSVSVDPIICNPSTTLSLEKSLLFFYTGRSRKACEILNRQKDAIKVSSSYIDPILKKMVDLTFILKENLEQNNIENFGSILHENWALKKALANGISDEEIDFYYETAIKAGADGGKLLGAGGGGFLMFYAKPEKHEKITHAMKNLSKHLFKFEKHGSQIIHYQP